MSLPHYTLIRGHRRSISIQFDRTGNLIVKAPHLVPQFVINRFLKEKKDWITRHHQKLQSLPVKKNGAIEHGDELLYLGNSYKLNITNVPTISVTDTLNFPSVLSFRIHKELTGWYMREAKRIITERVTHYSKETNTQYRSLSFSDTISKWGSCSPDDHLQFSWRLVMAPLLVIDYVVVHELIHTIHKHHQRSFWREVEKHKPAYRQYIKWLKTNGPKVHAMLAKA